MKHFHKTRPELREWILAAARGGHGPLEVVKLMQESGYDAQQTAIVSVTKGTAFVIEK